MLVWEMLKAKNTVKKQKHNSTTKYTTVNKQINKQPNQELDSITKDIFSPLIILITLYIQKWTLKHHPHTPMKRK